MHLYFARSRYCVSVRETELMNISLCLRDRTVAHFGEGPHGRNFGWALTSLHTLLVKCKRNKKYDFKENRNLQLALRAYMQIVTSVRRVRMCIRVRTSLHQSQ